MFYRFAKVLVWIYLHLRFRLGARGVENIPVGGCIVAMNHTGNYDPLIVGLYMPRKMRIMAKKELFKNRLFTWVLTELGAFPVKRGAADVRSLRTSLEIVQNGDIFAIFIEGTRSRTGRMQIPKKGVGFITSKSRAPVVPTYIYGANSGWRAKAGVVFGPPMTFDEGDDYEAIAGKIAEAIQKLAKESE